MKEARGFHRFSPRGKYKVGCDWRLVRAVSNLLERFCPLRGWKSRSIGGRPAIQTKTTAPGQAIAENAPRQQTDLVPYPRESL